MKHTKKILALALALALALTLAVPAFADDDPITIPGISGTITLPNKIDENQNGNSTNTVTRTYVAYQIFSATYAKEVAGTVVTDPKQLVGIKWGNGINAQAFLEALQNDSAFVKDGTNLFAGIEYEENDDSLTMNPSALAVAVIVSEWADKSSEASAFGALADSFREGKPYYEVDDDLPTGYYLIVDNTNTTVEGYVRNLSTLTIITTPTKFKPNVKVNVPELEKKVLEIDDSQPRTEGSSRTEWGSVADYDINDIVPFVLTGTVPDGYEYYETYRYVFHDTLSSGLRFNDDVQVFVNGIELKAENDKPYKVEQDGSSFTVTFEDLKTVQSVEAGTTIQVLYTATLNGEGVVYGGTGNPNTAYLEYSNDPNYRSAGKPGDPPTGETPPSKVTVFTFKLNAYKVDENNTTLGGAGFTLYKLFAADSQTPDPITLPEGAAESVPARGENKGTYYPVATLGPVVTIDGVETKLTTFEFKGLDDGEYMLCETTVPAGYNKAEDMYFSVTAVEGLKDGVLQVTSLTVSPVTDADGNVYTNGDDTNRNDDVFTITPTAIDGTMATTIVNLRGVVLPGTGGIGTTIFYVLGGVLLVGAGVVLIARKRMGKPE